MKAYLIALALICGSVMATQPAQSAQSHSAGISTFADIVNAVIPSVVSITTVIPMDLINPGVDIQPRRGIPPADPIQYRPDQNLKTPGRGSGFILAHNGVIMTNAHVVENADNIQVTLWDRRKFKAKIIGMDLLTDVAVLKIEATGLPIVKIGNDHSLRSGDWVVAIGAPFGMINSVTAGIVSAKNRDVGDYTLYIQTDTVINPGNSGGPLFNIQGEVIGINSKIRSLTGRFEGISLAIPISEAVLISDQLMVSGKINRGRIGVSVSDVTEEVAAAVKFDKEYGAWIQDVVPKGPADSAGIKSGDIIIKIQGDTVDTAGYLLRRLSTVKPGHTILITVFRAGVVLNLNVTLTELLPQDR